MSRRDFDPATVTPDGRPPRKRKLFEGAVEGPSRCQWRGPEDPVTIVIYGNDEPGTGPVLHVHPYDEVFITQQGRARFFVGDQIVDAEAGETVLGPAGVPHRLINLGPGRLQTLGIHLSRRWIQTNLE